MLDLYFCKFLFFFERFASFCFDCKLLFHDVLPEDGMGNISKWRALLVERTAKKQNINLMQLVYGKSASTSNTFINEVQDDSENEESDGEFFKPKGEQKKVCPGHNLWHDCFLIFQVLHTRDAQVCHPVDHHIFTYFHPSHCYSHYFFGITVEFERRIRQ